MSDWQNVIAEESLGNGGRVLTEVDGVEVAVFKLDGRFYAIEDVCPHDGGELASGELDGDEIVCPRHGARFCIRTGEVKCAPAYENLACYPVRVAGGWVQVRDERS